MFVAPLTAKRDEGRTIFRMEIHIKECDNGSSQEKEIEIRKGNSHITRKIG